MSRKNIVRGIVLGALCGFAASLLNKENREYVKETTSQAFDKADFYVRNPQVGVKNVKSGIVNVSEFLSENSSKAINALDQTEETLQKFLK